MSDQLQPDADLAIAHVLFIDIVAYSKLAIDQQKEVVQQLNHYVRDSEQFRRADTAGKLIRMPTGDGVALAFFTSPDAPVRCAIEVSKAVRNSSALQLRMGIHSGPVDQLSDVNERSNLAGTGINMAQRIMNCGDAGHILLSQRVADDLVQYTRWRSKLHELGEVELKHGVRVSVFNLYTDEVGNPEMPQKLRQAANKKPTEKARVPLRSPRLLATICVSCTALVMCLRFVPALPVVSHVWGHEQRLQDWLRRTGRRTATHPELVFVAISTKSLAGPEATKAGKDRMLQLMAQHPFPWSREVWVRLLDRSYQPYPIWEIADPDMWHSKYSDGEFFEDKIVIVGPSAPKLGDVIDNPISSEIKGPVMHLNVLAATMDHEFLRKLPVAVDLVIVAVFGLLAWLLLGYVGRWLICLLSFVGLSVAYLLLAFLLYNFLGIFVPIFPPLLTLLACGFLGFIAQQFHKRSQSMVHG